MSEEVHMEILVIGGNRFMGVHSVRERLAREHEVTVLNRGKLMDPFGADVRRVKLDRTDREACEDKLGGLKFDAVLDFAVSCSNDIRNVLDFVKTGRYVCVSSASVYTDWALDMREGSWNPYVQEPENMNYDGRFAEGKQGAETMALKKYEAVKPVCVRLPYVVGTDDYTKRLYFYADRITRGKSVFINYRDADIAFIDSKEAGTALARLCEDDTTGPLNLANPGARSIGYICDYVSQKTSKRVLQDESGEAAPYNFCPSFSLNTDYANSRGYKFRGLDEWFDNLLDEYIKTARSSAE
jgi:nucleoside-diphosphate-sugar epimerase